MGVFKRYNKTDRNGQVVLGKDGNPIKTGPWFVQYPYERDSITGKKKYRTIKSTYNKEKADKLFREKMDEFELKDKFSVRVDAEMTFSELMNWGLEQKVMKKKASASDDANRAIHLKNHFGSAKACRVTPLDADNFRFSMVETISEHTNKPFSGTSVNKMVSLARRIYYLAIDAGILKTNPFARRGAFTEHSTGKYIPAEEFEEILKHLQEHIKPIVITAYLTGMRQGEILNLTWDRVNLKQGVIDLSHLDTKTDEARRIYYGQLERLKAVFDDAAAKKARNQKLVFVRPDRSAHYKVDLDRKFKAACSKAKVTKYNFHCLRHTFNTNMLKAGVEQVVIMKMTGHKTPHMFIRYHHMDDEQAHSAMERFNRHMMQNSLGEAPCNKPDADGK